jgi:hypothetical protein
MIFWASQGTYNNGAVPFKDQGYAAKDEKGFDLVEQPTNVVIAKSGSITIKPYGRYQGVRSMLKCLGLRSNYV